MIQKRHKDTSKIQYRKKTVINIIYENACEYVIFAIFI